MALKKSHDKWKLLSYTLCTCKFSGVLSEISELELKAPPYDFKLYSQANLNYSIDYFMQIECELEHIKTVCR